MKFKVIRNISRDVVAFGPDEDGYDPVIPAECSLSIENFQPAQNTRQMAFSQIQAIETQAMMPRVTREFILGAFKAEAQKIGLDPMLLPAYAKLRALDDQIAALRAQL